MVDSEINLAALRKVDASISSIVDVGNQVGLYKYKSEANKWVSLTFIQCLFIITKLLKNKTTLFGFSHFFSCIIDYHQNNLMHKQKL